jgi:hypothetical protein
MIHSRKLFGVVALLVAIGLVAPLAFANDGDQKRHKNNHKKQHNYSKQLKGKHFSALGVVLEINSTDPEAQTMRVELEKANRILKEYLGAEVTFKISEDVRVKLEGTDPGVFSLTPEDVDVGDTVRVLGRYDGTQFVVQQIVLMED